MMGMPKSDHRSMSVTSLCCWFPNLGGRLILPCLSSSRRFSTMPPVSLTYLGPAALESPSMNSRGFSFLLDPPALMPQH